ncbi:hypothetical protein CYMTET_34489 [Cymbomonas tetramitiformis]|uniref:Uncharacterized protein n=1 Tax=Cymbomonas tetramitiformis TaxID=36881 RepID=A0AAE0FB44_9CHLO|nr:hypothetical protein CYMTET_34489 [Cymbomonas tetramitiformis]
MQRAGVGKSVPARVLPLAATRGYNFQRFPLLRTSTSLAAAIVFLYCLQASLHWSTHESLRQQHETHVAQVKSDFSLPSSEYSELDEASLLATKMTGDNAIAALAHISVNNGIQASKQVAAAGVKTRQAAPTTEMFSKSRPSSLPLPSLPPLPPPPSPRPSPPPPSPPLSPPPQRQRASGQAWQEAARAEEEARAAVSLRERRVGRDVAEGSSGSHGGTHGYGEDSEGPKKASSVLQAEMKAAETYVQRRERHKEKLQHDGPVMGGHGHGRRGEVDDSAHEHGEHATRGGRAVSHGHAHRDKWVKDSMRADDNSKV